jgi:GWxTD domain-containing protein
MTFPGRYPMGRMRIARVAPLLLVLLFALPAVLPAATLPELFQKAKEEVKLGSYDSALKTLQELETASSQPGFEKDKAALSPVLAFYKGVCHAALGKTDEARAEFTAYLATSPNASMDPAMYPKKVVAVFEETRRAAASAKSDGGGGDGSGGGGGGVGITAAYQGFKVQPSARTPEGEDWADGPAHLLLTGSEADEYRHLADAVARSEFITKFWKSRDPKPETPENEFRDEFEKRAAFADQYFVQGEKRGSLTDRGMVFILLGPPARSSQKPMQTGDDTADPAALSLFTPGTQQEATIGGKGTGLSRSQTVANTEKTSGLGTSMNSPSSNWREVWRYYRKDLKGLPYEYVDIQFITKPGYGENVLQRDPATLDALERAKANVPKS